MPSKEATNAAQRLFRYFNMAMHNCVSVEIDTLADAIDAAADAKYARLVELADVVLRRDGIYSDAADQLRAELTRLKGESQ